MARARFSLCFLLWLAAGCSSASFDVVAPGVDSGTPAADTALGDTALGDTGRPVDPTDSAPMVDSAITEAPPPMCTPIGAPLTTIYVDGKTTVTASNGASGCPFKTIQAAVTYAGMHPVAARTIKVAAGTYNETGPVILKQRISLIGAGVTSTTIMGGGPCLGIGNCVVRVEGGATLENVTVDASPTAKHAIVTGSTDPGGYPVLKNVKATGAIGDGNAGILTSAGSQLGPNVEASGNKLRPRRVEQSKDDDHRRGQSI